MGREIVNGPALADAVRASSIIPCLQAWVMMSGDQLAYAPHLRKAPLPGVPTKSVIYQFAKGDEAVPNPATSALLRAGDLADRATYYRNDLAHAEDPQVPTQPHQFLWFFSPIRRIKGE